MRHEAEVALDVARRAADLVMAVYAAPFEVDYKVGDDPVTRADREANALACGLLERAFPGVPIVAEESDPAAYAGFGRASRAWFVDPLDGTREFVKRNGEFCVMIGLAVEGRAILGAIVVPSWDRAFVGVIGEGAWEMTSTGIARPIHVSARKRGAPGKLNVLISRSAPPPRLPELLSTLGADATPLGSCGLKGVTVATGAADAYVHPGAAGSRWDACATEALVRAAGGACTQASGMAFEYSSGQLDNRGGLIASNGLEHSRIVAALHDW